MERFRPSLLDALLAGSLLLLAQVEVWTGIVEGSRWVTVPTAILVTVPLAWRRAAPLPVALAVGSAVALRSLLGVDTNSGVTETIALVLILFSVAFYSRLEAAVVGFLALLGLAWVSVASTEGVDASDYVFAFFLVLAPWLAGRGAAALQSRAHGAEQRAEQLLEIQEAQVKTALAEERQRIARELHDVIAHNITVMLMNVGAARRLLSPEQEKQRESLLVVEEAGRSALAEMRRLVGMLRLPDEAAALEPQPSLRRIDQLVDETRRMGLQVELRVDGCLDDLPAGVDMAGYRIVQESLTNVVKHAGASKAEVSIARGHDGLDIRVVNDGKLSTAPQNLGHGLVGMRERAALYGGSLEAGPLPGGGFSVRAHLVTDERKE